MSIANTRARHTALQTPNTGITAMVKPSLFAAIAGTQARWVRIVFAGAAASLCVAQTAAADLAVAFDEGAPKDRFTFQNIGNCPISGAVLTLDLSGSAAGLIFDVTGQGAGVEVFQPLDVVDGADALAGLPTARDGDTQVAIDIVALAPGDAIAFTIDVDDTAGGREITVSDAEIQGASVRIDLAGATSTGVFEADARTMVRTGAC